MNSFFGVYVLVYDMWWMCIVGVWHVVGMYSCVVCSGCVLSVCSMRWVCIGM